MSPASDADSLDDPPESTRGASEQAIHPSGDARWPGPSREELLGQRAHQRPSDEIDPTVVPSTVGDVPIPELPRLDDGVYLLEPDRQGSRSRRGAVLSSVHALALDTALADGGDVVWIDAQGHATTHTLARVAPSERALERVHVARAFTTHQHHTLVEGVGRWLRGAPESPFGTPATDRPAVVVCPALDALYRAGELCAPDAQALLVRALAVLGAVAREHDLPVLVTRTRADDYTAPIDDATTTIALERTAFGPRFECDALDFETLAYPVDDGVVQTTFAFWREILSARHPDLAGVTDDTGQSTTATVATPATTTDPGAGGR